MLNYKLMCTGVCAGILKFKETSIKCKFYSQRNETSTCSFEMVELLLRFMNVLKSRRTLTSANISR